jgi:hypothetical protein
MGFLIFPLEPFEFWNYAFSLFLKGGIMKFKTLAVITALIMFVLGARYLFAQTVFVGRWQI